MSDEIIFENPIPACTETPKKEKKAKKPMPLAVRILLVIASVLLCVSLFASLLATAVALDLNMMFRDTTLVKLVDEVLYVPLPSPDRLSSEPGETESLISQLIYEALQKQDDEDALKFTQADVDAFVNEATISDYLADKTVSYLQDFINGTNSTTISTQELEELIDDNKELIEQTFDVTVDETLRGDILGYVEENDVNNIVQNQIIDEARSTPLAGEEFTLGNLMSILSAIASVPVIIALCAGDLLLLVALFFTNRMRFGSTMICAGIPTILAGLILTLPVLAARSLLPSLLSQMPRQASNIANLLLSIITPIHLAILIAGAVLLIAGIVAKIVFRPKKTA